MNIPAIQGIIKRRILVNFRADPAIVQAQLPQPFRPKLHDGHAIVGICLIRLEKIRPASCSLPLGLSSENAAHRIAVVWDDEGGNAREGVFIPRRDTASTLNHLTGGRLFPGQHSLARFTVNTTENAIDFHMLSDDKTVEVCVVGEVATNLQETSCFPSLQAASAFFETGSLGYSVRHDSDELDGLLLNTNSWHVNALEVSNVYSSYYADESLFPAGSVQFDHALLMRDIKHEWHSAKEPGKCLADRK